MKSDIFFEPHYTNFLDLAMESHLLKFLRVRYGQKYIVRQKSVLGMMVMEFSRKRNYLKKIQPPKKGVYRIYFTYTELRHYHLDLSKKKKDLIIKTMDALMREDMVFYIDTSVVRTQNARESLREWMARYDILESDLNFDSMYQYYKRSKNFKIKNIKSAKKALNQ